MIELKDIEVSYADGTGLKDIRVEIQSGDVIAVIGPSGSGKSTLLKCINLLQRPTSGQIFMDELELTAPDTDLYAIRTQVGMVFQAPTLFSHKTLIENVMMGQIDLLGKSRQQAFDDAKNYLSQVGLGEKLYAFPSELSGGQKQRGEIARCLAMNPKILLLDEPTSALDSLMAGEVQAVINRLAQQKMTMVLVTHDLRFCRKIANRIFFMHEGRIIEEGSPAQIFEHPQHDLTREFVQRMRTYTYAIRSKEFDLYALNAGLEAFGRDYFIKPRLILNTQLLLEELIIHNLLKQTEEIDIGVRYFEEDGQIKLSFDYDGNAFDPFSSDKEDVLSMLLVRQLSQNVCYSYDSRNHLQMTLS